MSPQFPNELELGDGGETPDLVVRRTGQLRGGEEAGASQTPGQTRANSPDRLDRHLLQSLRDRPRIRPQADLRSLLLGLFAGQFGQSMGRGDTHGDRKAKVPPNPLTKRTSPRRPLLSTRRPGADLKKCLVNRINQDLLDLLFERPH